MGARACVLSIYQWLVEHPLYVWGVLSAVLNMARHYRWLDRLEQTQWGAAGLDLVRAVGIDPAGALRVASTLASGKAASLGATVLLPPPSNRGDVTQPSNTGGSND